MDIIIGTLIRPAGKQLSSTLSFTGRSASSSSSNCPFKVLGLTSPSSKSQKNNNNPISMTATTPSYKEVSLAFRQLALQHHPDTAGSQNGNGTATSTSFTEIREAFEAIIEGPNGEAILKNDSIFFQHSSSQNNLSKSEQHQNNNKMDIDNAQSRPQPHDSQMFHSSLNPQILREVAQVAEEMNPGGLDKGGMWQYANMVNRMAKSRDGLPPLRVDGGGEGVDGKSGVSRRRRKKR